jgi:endonuclease III
MPSLDESYSTMIAALADQYGQPQFPVEGLPAFEAVLAVGLTRAGDLARADATLEALYRAGLLLPETLAGSEPVEILDTLREAGVTLPAKSASLLRRLARWFSTALGNEAEALDGLAPPTSRLREQLTALSGIGSATADAILLALGRPTYPVDRGTYRILVRHGWIDPSAEYDEVSELLNKQADENPRELARLAHWLVQVGRQFCGLKSPKCQRCPLRGLLPVDGPLEPESG